MSLSIWILLIAGLTQLCTAYVKPNYPKSPLTKEENQKLLRTCGLPPIESTIRSDNKIWNPNNVNRTEAPWAVAILLAQGWKPNMTAEEMCDAEWHTTGALQHASIVAAQCENETSVDMFCSKAPYQQPCSGDSGAGIIETNRHERKLVQATHTGCSDCFVVNYETVFVPNNSSNHHHTMVKPHLYWIYEATGICANEEVEKDVEKWNKLPNRHRERYVVREPLEEHEIYV